MALLHMFVSPSCRDLQTVLNNVGEIGELITTIDVLAMETEVGVSIPYVIMLVQPCGNVQSVDISKVSAASQQLSLVAEFQLKECTGEGVQYS